MNIQRFSGVEFSPHHTQTATDGRLVVGTQIKVTSELDLHRYGLKPSEGRDAAYVELETNGDVLTLKDRGNTNAHFTTKDQKPKLLQLLLSASLPPETARIFAEYFTKR